MNGIKPAIIVAAYNRDQSLTRLLKMLAGARYVTKDIPLVISIDGGGAEAVKTVADSFEWKHGEKTVISHDHNLGLREHILRCGDLSDKYGAVIVLEDDLGVSNFFYQYAEQALEMFGGCQDIAGVSLYKHLINVNCGSRFEPLDNGLGYYCMQFAQSWGQMWTRDQWRAFRNWYDVEDNLNKPLDIPRFVNSWPESSWLKYFIRYVVDKNKYFVYPVKSQTTNFSDMGTHMAQLNNNIYQVPLAEYKLELSRDVSTEVVHYDAYFEITEKSLRSFSKDLPQDSLIIDLYGIRNLENYPASQLVLTTRSCDKRIKSWGFRYKPREMNIIQDLSGEMVSLCQNKDISDQRRTEYLLREFTYDRRWLGSRDMMKLLSYSLLTRLFKKS
ncbi:hypothetical protein JO972_16330 [Verrucomicrobiaceae bacterium 5K15]|uniref:Glycosyltransferase 2-like domain-containing protein n=1 Tax=Oceaniferula flava TaxID=2800421 RepID=A0AAE2SER1_9BACT|nr:hypothetical protein [Oceaniferula flavus]MBK1856538.1 hypothetical protein [Oceaniferula flavus]MBM1137845.1 hypothetical protein [Oceaniferula flavus]